MVKFKELTDTQKAAVAARLETRRKIYQKILRRELVSASILIVGDRPGPAAPKDPEYHHTPFYSIKHCSGWLNALLEVHGIPEESLAWINARDTRDVMFPRTWLSGQEFEAIISLGGNAAKWCENYFDVTEYCELYNCEYFKVAHPQYHKRFENKKPYPLIDVLTKLTAR